MNHTESAVLLIRHALEVEEMEIFPVWQCKTLQNWKGIFASPKEKMLFEVTYDGDKKAYYIDVYDKRENHVYREAYNRQMLDEAAEEAAESAAAPVFATLFRSA